MDKRKLSRLEKLVFYILAHRPDEFALAPNEEGFLELKELAQAIREEPGWGHIREQTLKNLFLFDRPERFEFREGLVRALPGLRDNHPLPTPATPPLLLYAVIRQRAWFHVSQKGLSPSKGRFIRLYASQELAERARGRLGPRAIRLEVLAQEAQAQGTAFWRVGELVYLCEWLEPQFLKGPSLDRENLGFPKKRQDKKAREKKATKEPAPHQMPGSTTLKDPARKGRRKDPAWKRHRRRFRRS
ncbi:RNA 2'-phosphotransferase [Thermosulfuriphilus sp.]